MNEYTPLRRFYAWVGFLTILLATSFVAGFLVTGILHCI